MEIAIAEAGLVHVKGYTTKRGKHVGAYVRGSHGNRASIGKRVTAIAKDGSTVTGTLQKARLGNRFSVQTKSGKVPIRDLAPKAAPVRDSAQKQQAAKPAPPKAAEPWRGPSGRMRNLRTMSDEKFAVLERRASEVAHTPGETDVAGRVAVAKERFRRWDAALEKVGIRPRGSFTADEKSVVAGPWRILPDGMVEVLTEDDALTGRGRKLKMTVAEVKRLQAEERKPAAVTKGTLSFTPLPKPKPAKLPPLEAGLDAYKTMMAAPRTSDQAAYMAWASKGEKALSRMSRVKLAEMRELPAADLRKLNELATALNHHETAALLQAALRLKRR